MAFDQLIRNIQKMSNPTVAGLDPKLDFIPGFIKERAFAQYGNTLEAAAQALLDFNKGLIDALYDIVPAVKPQCAYYELYGWQGMRALQQTIAYAKAKGMFVITDGKRNDIGTTMQAYAAAHLGNVQVNGQALPVTAKAVDVPVPLISTNISADATSDLKAASPKAVAGYVSAALAGVSGISAQILTTGEYDEDGVPTVAGQAGVIYLVPMAGGEHNVYREFLYINGAFETIGTTAVDLSGYVQKTDLVEFTNGEIDAIWTSALGE